MWIILMFTSYSFALGSGYRKSTENLGKRQYQIQNGPCSYTFLLPEMDNCRTSSYPYATNAVQRDDPAEYDESVQRLELLEDIMENNTQWLLKVINQTTRLELQLLENSLSTNKLEKQILVQTNEITRLHEKNSFLEKRVLEIEDQRLAELKTLKDEKDQIKQLVLRQNSIIEELEQQLVTATSNNSVLQKQQHDLMETVNNLIAIISPPNLKTSVMATEAQTHYKDCAELYKSGKTTSGVYALTLPNTTEQIKAYCDMDSSGGGWTVIQRRIDGRVDFHRTWKEYKMGFGDSAGEYWLGNEFVSQLTNQQPHALKIQLKDWEGNEAYSIYEHFFLNSEAQNYRIHLKGYSGTAGKISSLGQPGNDFSTKDADNDKCICKCSQLTTGGWWFDACGPSNLNGMYYQLGQNTNRFNGIKWYYWKGSGYSLKATTMMIRPANF
ncbi:angiopoietin-2-like [Acipenser oxyrinchus oxyrinchus]|uniref:Angiopoietin-2-like n=1 Tax=Acipenser oxyrinchus oxyrinchus TaxID=40147 RepID=A0AAD8LQA1_ACIOX|nr:angiopoietin-2-like [Acipenser oxyrinchus oxyrinchus]